MCVFGSKGLPQDSKTKQAKEDRKMKQIEAMTIETAEAANVRGGAVCLYCKNCLKVGDKYVCGKLNAYTYETDVCDNYEQE